MGRDSVEAVIEPGTRFVTKKKEALKKKRRKLKEKEAEAKIVVVKG
jgi:hypothetical protein